MHILGPRACRRGCGLPLLAFPNTTQAQLNGTQCDGCVFMQNVGEQFRKGEKCCARPGVHLRGALVRCRKDKSEPGSGLESESLRSVFGLLKFERAAGLGLQNFKLCAPCLCPWGVESHRLLSVACIC